MQYHRTILVLTFYFVCVLFSCLFLLVYLVDFGGTPSGIQHLFLDVCLGVTDSGDHMGSGGQIRVGNDHGKSHTYTVLSPQTLVNFSLAKFLWVLFFLLICLLLLGNN